MKFFAKEMQWAEQAECRQADPELFFDGDQGTSKEENFANRELAKQICRQCVVRDDCLEYALDHGQDFGVWGGLDQDERKKLKKPNAASSSRTQTE